jgi:APA family basic amino acid/polyamine antiporter
VRKTVLENASDLLVLGWPGYTNTAGRLFGSVIDPILDNPPTDIAVVRYRAFRPLRSILVPVAGGPNSRRAARMAVSMARGEADGPVRVTLLHVLQPGSGPADKVRAGQAMDYALEGLSYEAVERRVVEGADVVSAVLAAAEGHDLIVVGATQEPLFKNLLMGNIPEQVARRAAVTVIMVKRRSSPLHSFLRQTVLEPTTQDEIGLGSGRCEA